MSECGEIMKLSDDLRRSVLQAAIQGKLTEQRIEDGNAEDLLKQIRAEKKKLIAEGKLKKEKPLPPIDDEEKPFEIPDNWAWVRLGDVLDVRDGTHESPAYHSSGIPLITSKNLVNGKIDWDNVKYISENDADKINQRSAVSENDILMAMIGSIGKPVLVNKIHHKFSIKNMALIKSLPNVSLNMKYILKIINFSEQMMIEQSKGGVQKFIPLNYIRMFSIPLPPLAEQKRIVERLNELLPLCEAMKGE